MAIQEACQVWIEQRIEEEIENGADATKSARSIGREIAAEIEKIFKAKVSPDAIRMRYSRTAENGTNVPQKSQPPETIANSTPEIIKDRKPQGGGSRKNAGRPPKELFICKQCGCEFESIEYAYEMDGGRCSECQIKNPKPKLKHTETHEVSDAIMITSIIISQLERIKKSDPKRQEAFEIIIKWIEANREG